MVQPIKMYNGVVIHQHPNVLRTSTGSGGIKVGHALFLGAQAAVFAVGGNPEWNKQASVSGEFSE